MKSVKLIEGDDSDFDPSLGLEIADTWWALGRWTTRLREADTEAKRNAVAKEWADGINADSAKFPDSDLTVKPPDLRRFVEKILSLLERKYRAERIGSE